jgi:hypothetical protein
MSRTEYVAVLHAPIVRRRTIIEVESGTISAFCVQLEFNHSPQSGQANDWQYIARFDHKPSSQHGHDIREEGLHIDVRHPQEGDRTYTGFPPVPLDQAPKYAENHFDEMYLDICERYLEWCTDVEESWMATLPLPR